MYSTSCLKVSLFHLLVHPRDTIQYRIK
ncbi:hypothetical protein NC652_025769 [Populus alba x Populus x berolinensis]|uniref:Uncharacterized protein n=1 Tax=Populus alba x Populus x berolinensis TaxID=444605 RepID=A0AAD6Q901_9ROSI|nr:hypothetical protein NC651_024670 [Populus alba x Populus x berolinensis]KAJ6899404.1 hypothetical protein NC652_025769 [Populus alba x Populus x berolinensis]KAJ6982265.1 hypothetical protein NC653_025391 [Populus alba x Populus x berolinensis]